jgi:hypothetical protein
MDDSSKDQEPAGQELIEIVVSLTDLPPIIIQRELEQILDIPKKNVEEVSLEKLREAMLAYLDFVDAQMRSRFEAGGESGSSSGH